jgi:tRNA A-37 threonylcarbamoyl transferase component Bud32/tetratricopeptide (TPR) repeat protein
MSSPVHPAPGPERLGKYWLLSRLGRGATAEVYKAQHPTLGRPVAIKVLHAHLADAPDFVARFRREARAIAQLQHPHIVQVYDFDVDGDRPYMVMEYVAGPTLKARLDDLFQRGERLPLPEVLQLFQALLAAVGYAHAHGMIHRDLKPANILLAHGNRAVLTDFGITRLLSGERVTESGVTMGTPAYMSPEQAQGETVDHRADLYALGVILFECLSGQVPFDADASVAVLLKHLNAPIPLVRPLNHGLPPAVEGVVAKALAKRPEDRYQTAGEMWAALQPLAITAGLAPNALAEGPAGWPAPAIAPDTTRAGPPAAPARLTWRYWLLGAVFVVGVAAGATWFATRPASSARAVTIGQMWMAQGDPQLAADSFGVALDTNPANTAALAGRAQAYEQLGRIEDALADVEAWIRATPNAAVAYTERARLEVQYGLYSVPEQVLADLDHALALARPEEQARVYFVRGWAILNFPLVDGAPNAAAALTDLAASVERDQANAEAQFTLAQAHLLAGQPAEALPAANRAIELGPPTALAHTLRAHIQFALEDQLAALDDLSAALTFDAEPAQRATLLAERAYLYHQLGETEAATADVNEARQLAAQAPLPGYVALLLRPGAALPAPAELEQAQRQAADDPIWQAIFAQLLER